MTNNNKINDILALNLAWGYLNHNKKNYSERRNHGLSLTNLTHCISLPSDYCNDYYSNDSFNKINLQLHASSKVSNPYTFSITRNVTFSAICEEDWSGGGK